MPGNNASKPIIIVYSCVAAFNMALTIGTIFDGVIEAFIFCLILFLLNLFGVIICCFCCIIDKYLILEDNKIKIRRYYLCRFKDEVYNNEDLIKSEIKYEKRVDSEGDSYYYYFISIITKEEKQIIIFKIQENKQIDNMEGLNNLIECLNSYIQSKKELNVL